MTFSVTTAEWHWGRLAGRWSANNFAEMANFLQSYSGSGIHVGIYDRPVQASHSDLDSAYDSSRHIILNGYVQNFTTPTTNNHGTAIAGLIAAESNGLGGTGIAAGASITGINIYEVIDGSGIRASTDAERAALLSAADTRFDVINLSWGGARHAYTQQSDADVVQDVAAFRSLADVGRGGLGTVIVKASGNDGWVGGDAHYDTRNALKEVIVVSAITEDGAEAYYSSSGANVLVCAPGGSDVPGSRALYTTDLSGSAGSDPGDFTNGSTDFYGTSAAAPLVTGVVALMLDVNANLGWRDVQTILSLSAEIPTSSLSAFADDLTPFNHSADWNGGGRHFDERFGYGEVNIPNAVRMAEIWGLFAAPQTSANEAVPAALTRNNLNLATNDFSVLEIPLNFTPSVKTEYVSLTIDFIHPLLYELTFELESPSGTTVRATFLDAPGDGALGGKVFTFGAQAFRGEDSAGLWKLRVHDNITELYTSGNPLHLWEFPSELYGTTPSKLTGIIRSVSMEVSGATASNDDIYHYTEEFFDIFSPTEQAARLALVDTNGGVDWINCAAMAQDLTIYLAAGTTSTASNGVSRSLFTLGATTLIENVVTGDGNDTIYGNTAANHIIGMRGNDLIFGHDGNDILEGGDGNDTLVGNENIFAQEADTLLGGAGDDQIHGEFTDTIDGGAGYDRLIAVNSYDWSLDLGATSIEYAVMGFGNDTITAATQTVGVSVFASGGNDVVTGSNYNDLIFGGVGDDVITGGDGDDSIVGEAGADSLSGGDGNDSIHFDAQDIYVHGGAGYDIGYIAAGSSAVGVTLDMATTSLEFLQDNAGYADTITAASQTVGVSIYAGGGADSVIGSAYADIIFGEAGDDILSGGGGNDTLSGGAGADRLEGGAGNDTLFAGAADGAVDVFVFSHLGAANQDTIHQFELGNDLIDLSSFAGKSFANVSIVVTGGSSAVYLDGQAVCTVSGVTGLTASNFVFAPAAPLEIAPKQFLALIQPSHDQSDLDHGMADRMAPWMIVGGEREMPVDWLF